MSMSEGLLRELEQEGRTTRRVLERVPDAHLAWKPHEKSRSLGQLALHIATVPGAVATLASTPVALGAHLRQRTGGGGRGGAVAGPRREPRESQKHPPGPGR